MSSALTLGAWEAERQRIVAEANQKRAEAAQGNQNAAKDRTQKTVAPQVVAAPNNRPEPKADKGKRSKTTTAKAAASKTNRGSVERMDAPSSGSITTFRMATFISMRMRQRGARITAGRTTGRSTRRCWARRSGRRSAALGRGIGSGRLDNKT